MLKVLCVDDEKLTLQYLVSLCRSIPEIDEVHGVNGGKEALSWLHENPCDLVFLDIEMPDMDGIRLTFEEEAVREIARQAIARKCGARGLRAIIEDAMLDTMFELPGMPDVNECIITKEAVSGGKPTLISGVGKRTARRAEKKTDETDAS